MQSIIKGILFTVLLGFFAVTVAEPLSPGARIDKHMIKAELLHDAGKHKEALKVMKDSVLTQTKEDSLNFKLPDDFYFKYALVALSAGSFDVAKDSAKKYIKAKEEEKGQSYYDALRLLIEAEKQEKITPMSFSDKFRADKHLALAERLYAAEDYAEAFSVMRDSISAQQQEQNLTLISPDEFPFEYAKMALAAGSIKVAHKLADEYIKATGEKGEFYHEALELLVEAERLENAKGLAGSGNYLWDRLKEAFGVYVDFVDAFWAVFFLPIILAVPLLIWIIRKPEYKKIIFSVLSIVVGGGLALSINYYTVYSSTNNVFEDHTTNRYIQTDLPALKEMQKTIVDSIQAREMRLDSTIETLQDSVKEISDHLDRHYYRLLNPRNPTSDNQLNKG